jgi:hypothetical protein
MVVFPIRCDPTQAPLPGGHQKSIDVSGAESFGNPIFV